MSVVKMSVVEEIEAAFEVRIVRWRVRSIRRSTRARVRCFAPRIASGLERGSDLDDQHHGRLSEVRGIAYSRGGPVDHFRRATINFFNKDGLRQDTENHSRSPEAIWILIVTGETATRKPLKQLAKSNMPLWSFSCNNTHTRVSSAWACVVVLADPRAFNATVTVSLSVSGENTL